MKYLNVLVVFTTICCLFSACDYFQSDVDSPYEDKAIVFTNNGKLKGTYIITGSHSYVETTTDLLPSLPAGEYNVFFVNEKVNGNICYFDGKNPTLVGNAEFVVSSSDKARSIPVSVKEITCRLSFKVGEGVKFSKAVVTGVPNSMYIDGELGDPKNLTFHNDCYVIAKKSMKVFVSVDVDDADQPIKVFEGVIDAQPGHTYTFNLRKDNFSVSDSVSE